MVFARQIHHFPNSQSTPLPPPSPISIPQVSLLSRTRANGTAKLRIVAFDAKSRMPVIRGDAVLARSDFKSWDEARVV